MINGRAFISLLASDALKQGAVKKFLQEKNLADMWAELFEETVETDVQTKKPLKRVQEITSLADMWAELFEETVETDVQTKKPLKRVQEITSFAALVSDMDPLMKLTTWVLGSSLTFIYILRTSFSITTRSKDTRRDLAR